ncbi:MAG: hypothetical protein OEM62_00345 [Acidobacteriota bacterium]|nr:hypothetical protein [Acidobacteriota bacterium]
MSATAMIVMLAICGVVWGGFGAMLIWMALLERRISASMVAGEPDQ